MTHECSTCRNTRSLLEGVNLDTGEPMYIECPDCAEKWPASDRLAFIVVFCFAAWAVITVAARMLFPSH